MTMNIRLAAFISAIGSPVLLFPVIVSYLTVLEMGVSAAMPVIVTVFGIFTALSLFLLVRKLRGEITNLDVSDRKQRARNIYLPSLGMVLSAAAWFYWSNLPFWDETLYFAGLLCLCFAINSIKKISLHTMIATYLSAMLLPVNKFACLGFFVFSAFIAWSRVVLRRHTREEVILGWVVGTVFGLLHVWIFKS